MVAKHYSTNKVYYLYRRYVIRFHCKKSVITHAMERFFLYYRSYHSNASPTVVGLASFKIEVYAYFLCLKLTTAYSIMTLIHSRSTSKAVSILLPGLYLPSTSILSPTDICKELENPSKRADVTSTLMKAAVVPYSVEMTLTIKVF